MNLNESLYVACYSSPSSHPLTCAHWKNDWYCQEADWKLIDVAASVRFRVSRSKNWKAMNCQSRRQMIYAGMKVRHELVIDMRLRLEEVFRALCLSSLKRLENLRSMQFTWVSLFPSVHRMTRDVLNLQSIRYRRLMRDCNNRICHGA